MAKHLMGLTTTGLLGVLLGCSGSGGSLDTSSLGSQLRGPPAPGTIVGIKTKCVAVEARATSDGAQVDLWSCDGGSNQSWAYDAGQLVGKGSGKCLDVKGDVQVSGTAIQIEACNGSAAQRWAFDGRQIKSTSGLCLGTAAGSSDNGAPLVLSPCASPVPQAESWTFGGNASLDGGTGDPGLTALPSDSVVDAIGFDLGVCSYSYPDDAAAFAQSYAFLTAAHVRHLRQNFVECADQTQLLGSGISEAIGTKVTMTSAQIAAKLAAVPDEFLSLIDYVEPQNEYDTCDKATEATDWEDPIVQNIRNIRAARDSDPKYAQIKVAGLGACWTADNAKLASYDLGSLTDLITIHDGFGYGAPDQGGAFAAKTNLARSVYRPGEPVYWTETGYCDAMKGDEFVSSNCMSDQIIAHYGPREVLTALQNGVERVYFDFLGDHPMDGGFQTAGWIDQNGNVKAQGYTWMNLAALLNDPGDPFTTTPLDVKFGGDDNMLQTLLTQKRDGSYHLLMWLAATEYLWKPNHTLPTPAAMKPVPAQSVVVTIPAGIQHAMQYVNEETCDATQTWTATSPGHPVPNYPKGADTHCYRFLPKTVDIVGGAVTVPVNGMVTDVVLSPAPITPIPMPPTFRESPALPLGT